MKEQIGFGLIGCGVWGDVHANTISVSPHAKFIGVCDADINRAEGFSKKYNADAHYNDVKELLNNNEIEAVSIATPDFTHTDLVCSALEAGKHVIVEKPLATTIEECNRIIELTRKKNLKLMVNYSNRWKTPFIHVKRLIDSGELGNLMMMNLKLNDTLYVPTKMLSWASNSNPLHFLGTHLIDLARWVSGSEVDRVYSVSRSKVLKNMDINTQDFFQSILELNNGATAYLENCWIISENAPSIFEFKAEFVGSKGNVKVDVSHHRMIEKYSIEGTGMPDVNDQYNLDGTTKGQVSIQHFIDCIINDTEPVVTGEDGLEATKVVVALEKSASLSQPVEITSLTN